VALRILFAGTPVFAERHLDALLNSPHDVVAVLTQPDRRAGRGKKEQPSPVKTRALKADIPVLQPVSLRDTTLQDELLALRVDIMVVVAYGLLLPQWVLDVPAMACLNVHASLLPRWRGAAPIQRAVAAGDTTSGVTIMQMDAGLDTGPMLHKVELTLASDETSGSLHDKLAAIGPPALLAVLSDPKTAIANGEKQDDAQATYASKISKAEGDIPWDQSAVVLDQLIRGLHPSPGCFSNINDHRLKIHAAQSVCLPATNDAPGTILRVDRNGLLVRCAEQALLITRAQLPGGKPLDVAQLINGNPDLFTPGDRLQSCHR